MPRELDLIVHTEDLVRAIYSGSKILMLDIPVLMVEVTFSSDKTAIADPRRDYAEKFAEYTGRGIPEYWIVDPVAALVMVCVLGGTAYKVAEFCGDIAAISPTFPALNLITA